MNFSRAGRAANKKEAAWIGLIDPDRSVLVTSKGESDRQSCRAAPPTLFASKCQFNGAVQQAGVRSASTASLSALADLDPRPITQQGHEPETAVARHRLG